MVARWRTSHVEVFSSSDKPMRPERVCRAITETLPNNGVLVADTGHSGIWAAATSNFARDSPSSACRAAGRSFPVALGAKCAAPERPVVCFTGDGGAYYHIGELETAVRNDIDVVIVVNNNRALGQDFGPFNKAYDGRNADRGQGAGCGYLRSAASPKSPRRSAAGGIRLSRIRTTSTTR